MLNGHDIKQKSVALVAGGAGFVGSHLCEALLAKGHLVICVDSFLTSSPGNIAALHDHPGFSFIEHDICNPLDVPGRIDQVYNLACAASPKHYQADPVHTVLTSVVGTWNLLKLADRHRARFLQASTSEVYGDPEVHPQPETYAGNVNCTGPRACYDEGKRVAETLCFDALRQASVNTRVARIFNTYGPRMRADDGRIVSNLVVQALAGEPLTIYGTGKQTRSFCYVEDLVEGLLRLMNVTPNPGAPVNLGNPGEFTILELAERVIAGTGSVSELVFEPLPVDDPKRRRPDISRARKLLRWEPAIALETGLRRTIDHFRALYPPDPALRRRSLGRTAVFGTDEADIIRLQETKHHA